MFIGRLGIRGKKVPFSDLCALPLDSFDIISVDVFDTLLLRDHTVQRGRFLEISRTLSRKLQVDVGALLDVRRRVHDLAYRAVALERPNGDATLLRMAEVQALLLGLDKSTAALFVSVELANEQRRLAANRRLCRFLEKMREHGKRVIALSDTSLSVENLEGLMTNLLKSSPIQKIYSSSDIGLTKHSGQVFRHISAVEDVAPARIVHCGDDEHSDVAMARAAGFKAILLPRPAWVRYSRKISAVLTLLNRKLN